MQIALSRIEKDDERELLQGHYSDFEQELKTKTDALRLRRQKIRALEREVQDLHSEFQLDREDYLETIRRQERSLKFYQQLLDKALPMLRRDNRFWDVDTIRSQSEWSDDTKRWLLPEHSLNRLKLPPADATTETYTAPGRMQSRFVTSSSSSSSLLSTSVPCSPLGRVDEESKSEEGGTDLLLLKKFQNTDNQAIVDSYFMPKRAKELLKRHNLNHSGGGGGSAGTLQWKSEPTKMRHILQTNHNNFAVFNAKMSNT